MGTRPPFLIAIMFFLAALFFLAMGFVLELLSDANNAIGGVRPYVVRETVLGQEMRTEARGRGNVTAVGA